eukprot:jgi/Chrzof1/15174/Cz09g30100.t1
MLHMCSQVHVSKYATLHNYYPTDFAAATASAIAHPAISIPTWRCALHTDKCTRVVCGINALQYIEFAAGRKHIHGSHWNQRRHAL